MRRDSSVAKVAGAGNRGQSQIRERGQRKRCAAYIADQIAVFGLTPTKNLLDFEIAMRKLPEVQNAEEEHGAVILARRGRRAIAGLLIESLQ
jgi:hypothetical protein